MCLISAANAGDLERVRVLVEEGAELEKDCGDGWTPLIIASYNGHLEVVRYLLEQGADRDKVANGGWTSLHLAAYQGHLETAKLLMVYGADLNARANDGRLPIDLGYRNTEEIRQAIRDEPRRRMDHGHKRATEQDRHPNAAPSAFAHQEEEEEVHQSNSKRPRLDEGTEAENGKIAEEDEDSEPSSNEEEDD